jgi:hypothetical protein
MNVKTQNYKSLENNIGKKQMANSFLDSAPNHHKRVTKVGKRKIEGMNQFGLSYIYTWKCQGNSLYSYLKQTKMYFFFFLQKTENRKLKQVLSGPLVSVVGGGYKERIQEVNVVETLCTHGCKWKN